MCCATDSRISFRLFVLFALTGAANVQSLNYGGAQFDSPRDLNSDSAAQKGSIVHNAAVTAAGVPAAHAVSAALRVRQPQSVFSS